MTFKETSFGPSKFGNCGWPGTDKGSSDSNKEEDMFSNDDLSANIDHSWLSQSSFFDNSHDIS